MYFPNFSVFSTDVILFILFILALVAICIHYIMCVFPLASFKNSYIEQGADEVPVSIIICARNEDDNLTEYLPKILTQNYSNFEVVVVNDCSYDNTENVIDEFAKIFPNLKKVTIKEDEYYKHGKKYAVLIGIKGAQHNHLLFTDADCFPADANWLKSMASGFVNKKEIVLGYGAYQKTDGFLNKLIRFDTFLIATHYLSAAIKGKAYMGVGRNLAYTKELFYKEKGFAKHYHLTSGDDDLFINQACSIENTNIALSQSATTLSIPKKTFTDWKRQKQRHLTTAPHYNSQSKSRITIAYASQYLFYISLISLLFFKTTWLIALGGLFIKIIVQLAAFNKASKKLHEPDLWQFSFVYELLLLLIYPIFHISKLLQTTNKWKS